MTEVQTQVSVNTEALKGAQTEVNDLRRQLQTLEIELESQKSLVSSTHCLSKLPEIPNSALSLQVVDISFTLRWPVAMELSAASLLHRNILTRWLLTPLSFLQKASLEGTLRDTEMRYNMEIESFNSVILGLEAELTQLRGNIQLQTQDYETLLNMKMKLEAEIATYRRLLDGEDFKWVEFLLSNDGAVWE